MNVPEPAVVYTRGEQPESILQADGAVVDSTGRLVAWFGAPERETFGGCALHPLQALGLVTEGALAPYDLSPEDLALAAGRSPDSPSMREQAANILARAGVSARTGRLGGLLESVVTAHRGPEARTARARLRSTVALLAGLPDPNGLAEAPCDCGGITYALSLARMALAYARLADPRGIPESGAQAAALTAAAIMTHPALTASPSDAGFRLMTAAGGPRIVAMSGGHGFLAAGITDRGLGMALKVDGGSEDALTVLAAVLMRDLGVIPASESASLAAMDRQDRRDPDGEVIGEIFANVRVHRTHLAGPTNLFGPPGREAAH